MGSAKTRRGLAALACVMSASLVLVACGGDDDDAGGSNKAEGKAPGQGKAECEGLTQWGDLTGKTVTMYTSIVAPEDQPHIDSYKLFEECTGAKVEYEGSKEFEAQLVVRVRSGNPPDLAYIPQPGLLNTLVKRHRQGRRGARHGVGQRRQVLERRLEAATAPSTASSTPLRSAPT